MRIALDCRSVFKGHGGIGSHAEKLARVLTDADKKSTYLLLTTSRLQETLTKQKNTVQLSFEAGMIDQNWEQLKLPDILKENKIDLYHNTCFSLPVVNTVKYRVSTIHDIVFRTIPELVDDSLRDYLDHWTEHAAKVADKIITVSEYSKNEIVKYYKISPDKISVIYNGIAPEFTKASTEKIEAVRKKYKIPETFVFYLGSIEPKKNIDLLFDAYRILPQNLKTTCPLVLAGGRGGKSYDLESAVRKRNLQKQIMLLGYVDDLDVVPLLSAASVFVYPSRYEGFGLPPLEAMACKTPAIVSNASCLPEVVGDAALIADANSPEDLMGKIKIILKDEDLRRNYSKKGYQRSKEFTWKKAAEQTLKIYRGLLEN